MIIYLQQKNIQLTVKRNLIHEVYFIYCKPDRSRLIQLKISQSTEKAGYFVQWLSMQIVKSIHEVIFIMHW